MGIPQSHPVMSKWQVPKMGDPHLIQRTPAAAGPGNPVRKSAHPQSVIRSGIEEIHLGGVCLGEGTLLARPL